MTAVRTITPPTIPPLYADMETLRALMAPGLGKDRFAATIRELETQGFPAADPLFKAHYWPAVKSWLDARNGLGRVKRATAVDGDENWDGEGEPDARTDPPPAQGRRRPVLVR